MGIDYGINAAVKLCLRTVRGAVRFVNERVRSVLYMVGSSTCKALLEAYNLYLNGNNKQLPVC